MIAVPLVLVLLGAVAAAPAPKKAGTVVQGALVDGWTGSPIASRPVRLARYSKDIAAATTDDQGRFRLEFADTLYSDPQLVILQPLSGAFAAARGMNGTELKVAIKEARAGVIDVGTLSVPDESLATQAFAPVCEEGRPGSAIPASGFVLLKNGPHLQGGWRPSPSAMSWPPPWKAVVCAEEALEEKGKYIGGGSAYKATWKVRVVRLPDGAVFSTTVSADPPYSTTSFTGTGDPSGALAGWLKSGALERINVHGLLTDYYTGKPLGMRTVRLYPEKTPQVVTDADGLFRFAGVAGNRMMLEAQIAGDRYGFLHTRDGKVLGVDAAMSKDGLVDLGVVRLETDDAETTYSKVCEGARVTTAPLVDLLVLRKKEKRLKSDTGAWTLERAAMGFSETWSPPWKAVLCLDEKWQMVGRYGDGQYGAGAFRVTWKARLVRMSDGTTFKTEITADPPSTGTQYGGNGDPKPGLLEWLKTQQ